MATKTPQLLDRFGFQLYTKYDIADGICALLPRWIPTAKLRMFLYNRLPNMSRYLYGYREAKNGH